MIEKSKTNAALEALHLVILKGRSMAYEKEPHQRIADLLDAAEYLVAIMRNQKDMTDTFGRCIAEISETYGCRHALVVFNEARDDVS